MVEVVVKSHVLFTASKINDSKLVSKAMATLRSIRLESRAVPPVAEDDLTPTTSTSPRTTAKPSVYFINIVISSCYQRS
jgi:hypothetical protein